MAMPCPGGRFTLAVFTSLCSSRRVCFRRWETGNPHHAFPERSTTTNEKFSGGIEVFRQCRTSRVAIFVGVIPHNTAPVDIVEKFPLRHCGVSPEERRRSSRSRVVGVVFNSTVKT